MKNIVQYDSFMARTKKDNVLIFAIFIGPSTILFILIGYQGKQKFSVSGRKICVKLNPKNVTLNTTSYIKYKIYVQNCVKD